ncbi:MAG: hypothetical protein JRI77_01610 [Deltaproteobacteria bacterium]|nr:hypothetical protein [Deltaproteobacteria bacterium]
MGCKMQPPESTGIGLSRIRKNIRLPSAKVHLMMPATGIVHSHFYLVTAACPA